MEEQRENQTVYKKTLLTVGAMLAASVAFVGMLSLLTVFIIGKSVGTPSSRSNETDERARVDALPGTGVHPEPKLAPPKGAPMRPMQAKSSTAI